MIGCLCIHGFTGAPFEVDPLVQYLQDKTDWHISVPTLPGHGQTLALNGIRYHDWFEHAEKALQELLQKCETVFCIGFSMGGMIACYLSVRYPVNKLVLLSAAAKYISPKQLALDIGEMLSDGVKGKLAKNELFIRYKRKFKQTPIMATFEFQQLVKRVRPMLKEVKIPTLIIQGTCDGIVPPKSAAFLFKQMESAKEKELLYIEGSKHMVCYHEKNQQLFEKIYFFLKR